LNRCPIKPAMPAGFLFVGFARFVSARSRGGVRRRTLGIISVLDSREE
jgi:hypothetical protein